VVLGCGRERERARAARVNRELHTSVVSARWLYCERRSGACGGRARSSLLRRSSGYASSVVAALARLGSRLDALATSHLADTTLEPEPTPLATVAPPLQQAVREETDRRAHTEQPRHRP